MFTKESWFINSSITNQFKQYNHALPTTTMMMNSPSLTVSSTKTMTLQSVTTSYIDSSLNERSDAKHHVTTTKAPPPKVPLSNVRTLAYLGKGGFSNVYKVLLVVDEVPDRQPSSVYAMKCLNPKKIHSDEELMIATADMMLEATLLGQLRHEHIVRLRGVASDKCLSKSFSVSTIGYYMIMELLGGGTLDNHLHTWRRRRVLGRVDGITTGSLSDSETGPPSSLERSPSICIYGNPNLYQRMEYVILALARAMNYLHEQGVVFRDLKPKNVGFTEDGTVKLFDFGLARRFEDCGPGEIAGSLRYLDPEILIATSSFVDNGNPQAAAAAALTGCKYNIIAADVYSFGVLAWEVATLERPYDSILTSSFREHRQQPPIPSTSSPSTSTEGDLMLLPGDKGNAQSALIHKLARKECGGEEWRHSVDGIPCRGARLLVQDCWNPNPASRPDFATICTMLETILSSNSAGGT